MATSALGRQNFEAAAPQVTAANTTPSIEIDRAHANALLDLDARGRLWVPGANNTMARIGAADAYTRLSRGEPVHIMRLAVTSQRSSHSTGEEYSRRNSFGSTTREEGSSVESSRNVAASYSFDCVRALELLKLVDCNSRGITGAPVIPSQGGRIQISHEFESTWMREHSHAGMLRAAVISNCTVSSGKDSIG